MKSRFSVPRPIPVVAALVCVGAIAVESALALVSCPSYTIISCNGNTYTVPAWSCPDGQFCYKVLTMDPNGCVNSAAGGCSTTPDPQ